MNTNQSNPRRWFFIALLAVALLASVPVIRADSSGQPVRRVPPAYLDPATGEKIIEIPADWQTYYPFSERFAEAKLAEEGDHLMDLRAVGFITDGLAGTDAGGQRTFRMPDLSMFPAGLVRQPFESVPRDYFIVQAGSPAQQTLLRARLEEAGVPILDYLPRFAYLVKLDAAALRSLAQASPVFWLGYFHPAFRVEPQLDYIYEADYQRVVKMTVRFDGESYPDLDSLTATLRTINARILDFARSSRGWTVRLEGPVAEARRLAVLPGCLWVERFVERELHNNIARTSVSTTTGRGASAGPILDVEDVWARGIRGEGQIASAADTGLSTGNLTTLHRDFGQSGSGTNPLRVIAGYALGRSGNWNDDYNTGGGHGTHTSGSIVGNGFRSGSTPNTNTFPTTCFAGTAPKAQFVFQSVMDSSGGLGGLPADLNDLFQQTYDDGARVHSNSWGAANAGLYNDDSQNLDIFAWNNKDMVITFSAGNSGTDRTSADGVINADSIGTPGTAKNCITVGASENYRPEFQYGYDYPVDGVQDCETVPTWYFFNYLSFATAPIRTDLMANNANGMGAFSSRGPCDDSRIKPDLAAPGIDIISTRTDVNPGIEEAGDCNLVAGLKPYYLAMCGTSMANPLTAGCATLVRQYYVDGWHANGSGVTHTSAVPGDGFNPSSALVKATLINGAWDMAPGQYGTGATKEIPPAWDAPHDLPNNVEGYGRVDVEHSLFPGFGYGDNANRTMAVYDVSPGLITGGYTDYTFTVSGNANPFIATLVWTDMRGALSAATELVNDLDLTATAPGGTVYYPNRLNFTTNTPDRKNNVEQVKVTSPASGTWTIRVRGFNVPGVGGVGTVQPYALVISGISTPCTATAPTGVAAAPYGDNAIQVTWNSVASATEYRVRRSTSAGGPYTQIGTATGLAYIDTSVTNGVTYYYVVRAYVGCESGDSLEASATAFVTCNLPPTFAGLTSATNAGSATCGINLAWSAATAQCGGAVSYSVYRSATSGFTPGGSNRIAVGLTGTSFSDLNGLAQGTICYYVVRAVDVGNGVEDSNLVQRSATASGPVTDSTWTAGAETGDPAMTLASPWSASTTRKRTGTYSYRSANATNYPDSICADLRTPSLMLTTGQSSSLSFWTAYNTIQNRDGGVVEVSTNGGSSWTRLTLSPPYPGSFARTGNQCGYARNSVCFNGSSTTFTNYTASLAVYNGQTVLLRWNFSSDSSINGEGWYIDDISITHVGSVVPCSSTPGDVQFLTSTSTNATVKLEWVNSTSNYGGNTRICRKTGSFPTGPNDGNIHDEPGSAGEYDTYTDTTGLVNGTVYYYAVYAQGSSGAYADGKTVNGRPFLNTGKVKWAFAAGASILAPPAVRPGAIGTGAVYAVANDRLLHATNPSATGGSWPETSPFDWSPSAMNAPAQSRPTVVFTPNYPPVPDCPRMVFQSSQDGYVYAINADDGTAYTSLGPPNLIWTSPAPVGETVQAGVAGMFREFSTAAPYDILFVATRNAATYNKIVALNPANGNKMWEFNNGAASDSTKAIGIICGKPSVDYANKRLYFASRRHGGGSPNTVWCITFDQSGATLDPGSGHGWVNDTVGDIDGAVTLSNGRVYLGTNTGWVYALNADTGAVLSSTHIDTTPVKSFVFPEYIGPGNWRVYCSTTNKVWGMTDNGTAFTNIWSVTSISSPSPPLRLYGNDALLVGGGDGKLYQIDVTSPGSTPLNVTLGLGTEAVGGLVYDLTNGLTYAGTDAGFLYAVSVPLP